MAGSTRLEINFNRLLHRCETMAEDKTQKSWRLEKYIGALQDQLAQMKKAHSRPAPEALTEYHKKVEFLKGLIEVEKMPVGSEKVMAAERLQPVTSVPASAPSRQLQARAKVQSQEDMRQELLGSKGMQEVRQRGLKGGSGEESEIDSLLQHHHRMQERLADEMLAHARVLKQNVTNAGRVVKEDVKKLGETTKVTESNYGRLQKESDRLEGFTQSCSWWVWIMLFFVIITFLAMIVFMKIFPK
ncbi:vesicle transport protein USE1-like isoform X2 [Babylonia areolata]|uniref:vesicle transport protein USE1-like isoform X2 n=1 Tax=Babylonia areolata TaxID=304850 RepID=UPI003FD1DE1F